MINIAIVEDEKNISQELENFVKEIFEKNNFDICISCFENAKSFIDQFSSSYDLIFMDDMMPKLSGRETLKKIKEDTTFKTPVVALTANVIAGMEEEYLEEGFDGYLPKPIERKALDNIVNKYLNK